MPKQQSATPLTPDQISELVRCYCIFQGVNKYDDIKLELKVGRGHIDTILKSWGKSDEILKSDPRLMPR